MVSIPIALAQCRGFLQQALPGVELVAANSTAEAARQLAEKPDPTVGAIAPARSATSTLEAESPVSDFDKLVEGTKSGKVLSDGGVGKKRGKK